VCARAGVNVWSLSPLAIPTPNSPRPSRKYLIAYRPPSCRATCHLDPVTTGTSLGAVWEGTITTSLKGIKPRPCWGVIWTAGNQAQPGNRMSGACTRVARLLAPPPSTGSIWTEMRQAVHRVNTQPRDSAVQGWRGDSIMHHAPPRTPQAA